MTQILNLPPRCTLVQAEEIARDCLAALDAGGGLQIDAGAVEEADVSLLQILVAARTSCEGAGRGFSLTLSPVLEALAVRAGFAVTGAGLVATEPEAASLL